MIFFLGLSDWDPKKSMVFGLAFFGHPRIQEIQERCFGTTIQSRALIGEIQDARLHLKKRYRVITETGMPTIAHHHDFAWERQRYIVNAVEDYLAMDFHQLLFPMYLIFPKNRPKGHRTFNRTCS